MALVGFKETIYTIFFLLIYQSSVKSYCIVLLLVPGFSERRNHGREQVTPYFVEALALLGQESQRVHGKNQYGTWH